MRDMSYVAGSPRTTHQRSTAVHWTPTRSTFLLPNSVGSSGKVGGERRTSKGFGEPSQRRSRQAMQMRTTQVAKVPAPCLGRLPLQQAHYEGQSRKAVQSGERLMGRR